MEQQRSRHLPKFVWPSKRLVASYVLDWIIIIILFAVGGALKFVKTVNRPFSLLDLTISYPYVQESISITTVALVTLLAPAVIIAITTLLLLPAPSIQRTLKRSQIWRRRTWELYTGISGLVLAVVLAFFITQGLKTVFAKPRPHFLAVCQPDLKNIAAHAVGGYGQDISARWTLVTASICTTNNKSLLSDSFRSFPSGHCSFSFSGMVYLVLFMCAKYSVTIPYLSPYLSRKMQAHSDDTELLPLHQRDTARSSQDKSPSPGFAADHTETGDDVHNKSAAAPIYGILLALIPLGTATYIASTRYTEFWHFGFDCLSGSFIGAVSAYLAFRWYNLPMGRGRGFAWGPRSFKRAFGIGHGVDGYVGPELWTSSRGVGQEL